MTEPEVITAMTVAGGVLVALIGLIGVWLGKKVTNLHLLVNSRLTELLDANKIAAKAEGVAEERDRQIAIAAGVAAVAAAKLVATADAASALVTNAAAAAATLADHPKAST